MIEEEVDNDGDKRERMIEEEVGNDRGRGRE